MAAESCANPAPAPAFAGLVFGRLSEPLRRAVADAGYREPTPIQSAAMPYLLAGRDFIGCAQTGTGKTAAFLLPILQRLSSVRKPRHIGHPRALVLSPTRELAAQTAESLRTFSKYLNLPFACVFGGVSQAGQVKDVRRGAETVVACPGRLIDLMTQGVLYLDQIECFVLDEADRMLDMGFLPDIRRIVGKLPKARQSMFFSATLSPEIRALAATLVTDPQETTIEPEKPAVEKIDQRVMFVAKSDKDALLQRLLAEHPEWTKTIVFVKMRHAADRVVRKLLKVGVKCAAIHSDKTQGQRTRALEGFRRGDLRVLVATDIASRGIDVPYVSCVVNLQLPMDCESYVHRIGRTARAGESGCAVSFVCTDEREQLKAVERFIRKSIRVDRDHPFHDGHADAAAGKTGEGLPSAPWVRPAAGRAGRKRRGKVNFAGRRQSDFGKRPDDGA